MRKSRRAERLSAAARQTAARQAAAGQAGRRPPVRQAPAASVALTEAELRSRRAVAAALRVQPPARRSRRAGRGQFSGAGTHPAGERRMRPVLRQRTGIVLAAIGAVLWLGVHARLAFVATQTAGFVLLLAGLAWLWIPVRGKREKFRRHLDRAMAYVAWQPGEASADRCSLDDLLKIPADDGTPLQ